VLALGCSSIALIFTPLYYRHVPVHFLFWRVARGEEALLCVAFGLILGLLSVHILNGLAAVNRAFATAMLSGPPTCPTKSRGPIVIP
jgi:hypothetical protein